MQFFIFFNEQLNSSAQIFLTSLFALIFGSFATLISYRLIHNEPMGFTRSKCTKCGYILKPQNLIPLFSWLFQKGKCSSCKANISARYPIIELTFLITFLTVLFTLDLHMNWIMILYLLIASTLIVMCVTDLEEYLIPNSTQYFLIILATILIILENGTSAVPSAIFDGFIYLGFGIALLLFFYLTTGMEAIGIDDLKFFFITGFMLGTDNFLSFMMLSGLLGIIFGSIWQKIMKDDSFPFAPAICCSTFLCLLFDKALDPVTLMGKLIF